jgi:microsomal dipeptidase-like Zn-dependent dipeptidase
VWGDAFEQVIDQARQAKKPVIYSHGSLVSGLLSDQSAGKQVRTDMLRDVGGLLGIHFFQGYVTPTIEAVVDRLDDAVANWGNARQVGLGVDLFPTTGLWLKLQGKQDSADLKWAIADLSEMPRVTSEIVRRKKYTEVQIRAILGGNFLRICKDVFGE